MSDLTLLQLARAMPQMVPLHLIARAWRLGDQAVRDAMFVRAMRATARTEFQRDAVRAVLIASKRASIEALSEVGAFENDILH